MWLSPLRVYVPLYDSKGEKVGVRVAIVKCPAVHPSARDWFYEVVRHGHMFLGLRRRWL
jgi:hypothetical protein